MYFLYYQGVQKDLHFDIDRSLYMAAILYSGAIYILCSEFVALFWAIIQSKFRVGLDFERTIYSSYML